jgi:AcrR family transcriptional regulator
MVQATGSGASASEVVAPPLAPPPLAPPQLAPPTDAATEITPPEVATATERRVPGRRGTETRRRLLAAVGALLDEQPYRSITVVDIARRAGTSPATFYQYFGEVEHAVLLLAEEAVADLVAVVDLARGEWTGVGDEPRAEALTRTMMEVWDRHRAVLTVMDLGVSEGDARFRAVRTSALSELARALEGVVADHQRRGRMPATVDAKATAGVLVGMLAHAAAHQPGLRESGIDDAHLVAAQARLLAWALTGTPPPTP